MFWMQDKWTLEI